MEDPVTTTNHRVVASTIGEAHPRDKKIPTVSEFMLVGIESGAHQRRVTLEWQARCLRQKVSVIGLENIDTIVLFDPPKGQVPTQPQIKGQSVRHLESVVGIKRVVPLVRTCERIFIGASARPIAEHIRRKTVARPRWGGGVLRSETVIEVEISGRVVRLQV